MTSYHPVSGLSFLSKLIERVVLFRLSSHVTNFNLLSPCQSAFRANYSTETALLAIQNDLLVAADAGLGSALLFLDLSAAFDTVDHCIRIERMATTFGVSGSASKWFWSYLSNRTQSVPYFWSVKARYIIADTSSVRRSAGICSGFISF